MKENMDPHKSILLQKQIRDNSEDLQREFLDMEAWEEQMKKKDFQIRNVNDDKVFVNLQPLWFWEYISLF